MSSVAMDEEMKSKAAARAEAAGRGDDAAAARVLGLRKGELSGKNGE